MAKITLQQRALAAAAERMCGRYAFQIEQARLEAALGLAPGSLALLGETASYNIAPQQQVPVVLQGEDGRWRAERFIWGLIPSWTRSLVRVNQPINARAETIFEKPSFRTPIRKRRCLIPMSGFFEWKCDGGGPRGPKTPYYIYPKEGGFFATAGIWDRWESSAGSDLFTCAIVTTEPNEMMAPIHHRMAVILPPEAWETWLDPKTDDPATIQPLMKPYPSKLMKAHPVSTIVNKPANNSPECIQRIKAKEQGELNIF